MVRAAVGLVRKGRVYDLGMDISRAMPQGDPRKMLQYGLFLYQTWKKQGSWPGFNGFSYSQEAIIRQTDTSTHIDAICHCQFQGKIYGGIDGEEASDDFGWLRHGIENVPPIVSRGIMFDICYYKGVERLEDTYEISPEDLKGLPMSRASRSRRETLR